jgi:phosphomannomutase
MSEHERKELREKILRGINVAFARLLQERQRDNRYLVISRDGRQIEQVKAAELMVCVEK